MKKSELKHIIKEEINRFLKENDHEEYVKKQVGAELVKGQVGELYHSTHINAAIDILKSNQIDPANIVFKDIINSDNPPWWFDDEFGDPQPLYGDFVYAASKYEDGYFGISTPDVTFAIDGDKVKNNGIDIYKAPETMEKGVVLIQGSIPLNFIKKVIIDKSSVDENNINKIIPILEKKNIPYSFS